MARLINRDEKKTSKVLDKRRMWAGGDALWKHADKPQYERGIKKFISIVEPTLN